MPLLRAIVRNDAKEVARSIRTTPSLTRASLTAGATRQTAAEFFFDEISHYLISGDTPLHAAAAGAHVEIAKLLVANGADVAAVNRRGATPLHYAADGGPGVDGWNPAAQAEMIVFLIEAGANPNALDKSGVAPLHRTVRQRSPRAATALLSNGANVRLKNKSGSTPLHLAVQNTGRGGTGSAESKSFQKEIIELLLKAGANIGDTDGRGKTARQAAQSEWIQSLL
jgi:ankyrin repeat protein